MNAKKNVQPSIGRLTISSVCYFRVVCFLLLLVTFWLMGKENNNNNRKNIYQDLFHGRMMAKKRKLFQHTRGI